MQCNTGAKHMDDFGNFYQDEQWFTENTNYGHAAATFGWLDDVACMMCFEYNIDYAAQDI